MGLARVFDDHLSGETHTAKRTRLAAELKSAGHAAAFISLPDSICWLLNIRGQDVAHNPWFMVLRYCMMMHVLICLCMPKRPKISVCI